jgi:Na+/H+-dicarboxylate symporter
MITAIPYSLALLWFVGVTVEAIVLGILAALIYKPAPSA